MSRCSLAALMLLSGVASAHQPVMDMAPRWEDGYGVQTRVERFDSRTTTWIEGVYTFRPSLRTTLKLPLRSGELGDAIVGLPLKRYRNDGARTANWSVTPSLALPTGSGSGIDPGLSLSYSAETPGLYQLYDLYTWPGYSGLDINVGPVFKLGPGRAFFALWDVTMRSGKRGDLVMTGPVAVYFRRNVIVRAEYKTTIYDHGNAGDGPYLSLGVGVVY